VQVKSDVKAGQIECKGVASEGNLASCGQSEGRFENLLFTIIERFTTEFQI
jgi:hypothetical protein